MVGRFARRLRDEESEPAPLPLPPGPVSNEEFVPARRSANDESIESMLRATLDDAARRVGMDQRRSCKARAP